MARSPAGSPSLSASTSSIPILATVPPPSPPLPSTNHQPFAPNTPSPPAHSRGQRLKKKNSPTSPPLGSEFTIAASPDRRGSNDSATSTSKKLSKWLPSGRDRSKSNSNVANRDHPSISLSPSSSAASDLSGLAPTASRSSSTSSTRRGQASAATPSTNASDTRQDVLDDWADGSLSPTLAGSLSSDPSAVEREGSITKNKPRFALRRKGSSLKLFGRDMPSSAPSPTFLPPSEVAESRPSTSSSYQALPSSASIKSYQQSQPAVTARIGGWFSSMLHSSTPPSSSQFPALPPPPVGSPNTSPKKLGPLDRMFDKAAQYFLDGDSAPDYNTSEIWLLGVQHPGYVPEEAPPSPADATSTNPPSTMANGRPSSNNGHSLTIASTTPQSQHQYSRKKDSNSPPGTGWPPSFYHDFYSRVGLTYRSGFPAIPCSPLQGSGGILNALSMSIGRGQERTAEGLSSDTGWGCMLRTGQSLLANALITVHLGRDWRRTLPQTDPLPTNPTYAQLLSLFIDDPTPQAPFSVHRFALKGKELGKEVGEWFGPSTAAGAIRQLVNAYPEAGLGVAEAQDGTIYKSTVETAAEGWKRPVLVLVQSRLGTDAVNPLYYEALKALFRFPQSVGIAGGRPSSSYYFVGSQASSLFYIDPHHPRPAVPFVPPPASATPEWYSTAYTDAELRSFHSEKVRKMPLASLDPSMLLGFLVRDQEDWEDFVARCKVLAKAYTPIFAVADALPSWMVDRRDSVTDSDRGVESFSEPEDEWLDSSSSPPDETWPPSNGHAVFVPGGRQSWDGEDDEDIEEGDTVEVTTADLSEGNWPTPTRTKTERPSPPGHEDSLVVVPTMAETSRNGMPAIDDEEVIDATTSPSETIILPPRSDTVDLSKAMPPSSSAERGTPPRPAQGEAAPLSFPSEDESMVFVPASTDSPKRKRDEHSAGEDGVMFEKKDGGWEGVALST